MCNRVLRNRNRRMVGLRATAPRLRDSEKLPTCDTAFGSLVAWAQNSSRPPHPTRVQHGAVAGGAVVGRPHSCRFDGQSGDACHPSVRPAPSGLHGHRARRRAAAATQRAGRSVHAHAVSGTSSCGTEITDACSAGGLGSHDLRRLQQIVRQLPCRRGRQHVPGLLWPDLVAATGVQPPRPARGDVDTQGGAAAHAAARARHDAAARLAAEAAERHRPNGAARHDQPGDDAVRLVRQ